jgi:hypothetical protein
MQGVRVWHLLLRYPGVERLDWERTAPTGDEIARFKRVVAVGAQREVLVGLLEIGELKVRHELNGGERVVERLRELCP